MKKKKQLVTRILKVGADRVKLDENRKDEIKEAITRQDIKDLVKSKAIIIKDVKGKRKKGKKRRKKKRKKIKTRKQDYVRLTRKLRKDVKKLLEEKKISKGQAKKLRKRIKAKAFRSGAHFHTLLKEEK